MLHKTIVPVLVVLAAIGCSKGKKEATKASPDLTVSMKEGRCLDLQSIVSQMAAPGFDYLGSIYTKNFEKVGPEAASTEFLNRLYAASFRAEIKNFRGVEELRGLRQNGCEEVTLPVLGGVVVKYRIFNFGPNRLEMHFDQSAFSEALNILPDAQRIRIVNFPMVKEYSIQIPSSRSIEVRSEYTTVPNHCQKAGSILVGEELVYKWASSDPVSESHAMINREYWNRILNIAGEPIVPDGMDGDVSVDLNAERGIVQTLRSKINERCL